ncbi:three-Cys-motif partner protein TcmP [Yoonia sp. R2-816]|uniref:three-Cys-motif partner protein TcmP n=1 Tax=Yoonia sp. R2-816 TaxID=3342638 RepID=UPI003728E541
MDERYNGREQSLAKHEILKRYLVPFANKILSQWESIDFIDGFSGPWENHDTANLTDTSIGVALSTLSAVARARKHQPNNSRIRCIFNERNAKSFGLLKDFVQRTRGLYPLIKVETFKGEFANNAAEISRVADHKFQLLFVDPTGYTGFPPSSLQQFKGRSSEVIVNVMRSFIERFVSGEHKDRERALIQLVGPKRAQFLLDTGLSIETVEDEYLKMLRGDLGYKFAGYSPIHNPDKNEIHFNLAYATNHFEGMEVMRSAEFGALSEHDRIRFSKKVRKAGPDLFDDMMGELEIEGPYLKTRKGHLSMARSVLQEVLSELPPSSAFGEVAAKAQQQLFLKRSELGDVMVEIADEGLVKPTWLDRGGRKPIVTDKIIRIGK